MIIVKTLFASVERLLDTSMLPDVEALRPASCPGCGHLARSPVSSRIGIVGHGTYERQVLGCPEVPYGICRIRRYRCGGCDRTMSILPDLLHPHRWYAAGVILEALRLHLVEQRTEREIRSRYGVLLTDGESWRSLRRWRRQLVFTLWGWLTAGLGTSGPAEDRAEGFRRLFRLLAQAGETDVRQPNAGLRAAPILLRRTVHHRLRCWRAGQDPPEFLLTHPPP